MTVPLWLKVMPSGAMPPRSTFWPMALMTESTSMVSNLPVPTGLRRPFSSASPSSISSTLSAVTFSPSPMISTGAQR